MLILISPAKTLDFETPAATGKTSQPALLDRSTELVDRLKGLSGKKLSDLMGMSAKLGELNQARYADWHTPFTKSNAKQALLAFKGDVYTGLEADSFSKSEFDYAQKHLRILSGLYGVLRPLDLIQPYRLEMGTKFATDKGKNLYEFWGGDITAAINKQLKALKTDVVLNLASNEYFKAINRKELNAEIVAPAFKDLSKGQYRMISFFAKKARGQMAAWVIHNEVTDPARLKKYRVDGYRYNAELSTPASPTFTRDTAPKK